ncbi:Protein APEM9 [Cardamine amara subsp. amara]|uniref:Protein APEM9 n=1 Tax=Cardamine amara subsp. amara TaxID=228776 RepID=A0ABD0YZN2_CARAN
MEATEIWGEIESSESYLVCSMYEEAKSLSSSILKRIFENIKVVSEEAIGDHQLYDMFESAGMVLVQSMHGLGRTVEILKELRDVFGEIAAIPVQVLLTGICLQISNGSYSGVCEILEDFFSIWVYKDNHYILNDAGVSVKGFHGKKFLDIAEYMEVVELFTFGVLGKDSKDMGLAISWVEKAALPEERREGLLRRLHSLVSLKTAKVSEARSFEENSKESSYTVVNSNKSLANEKNDDIDSVLKLSKQYEPWSLWSSHPLSLKLGNTQFSMSRGKVAISVVGLIICYALKRKRAAFIRIIRRQIESTKKAIADFWKLAFSYQVNPLAAIQSIPSTAT